MSTLTDVIIRPIISEKSMQGMRQGKYTFEVDPRASKSKIKEAVEAMFEVEVDKVNIVKKPAKPRRQGIFRGRTSERKKAIVTLKEGQVIKAFEGMM